MAERWRDDLRVVRVSLTNTDGTEPVPPGPAMFLLFMKWLVGVTKWLLEIRVSARAARTNPLTPTYD